MDTLRKPGTIFVNDENCIPLLGTEYSAGIDVKADIGLSSKEEKVREITIPPMDSRIISTGLDFQLPPGYYLYVFSKSGLAIYSGVYVEYKLENPYLNVCVYNSSQDTPFVVAHGQIIAQVIITCGKVVCDGVELDLLLSFTDAEVKPHSHALVPVHYNGTLKRNEGGIIRKNCTTKGLHLFPGVIDNDCEGRLSVFCINSKINDSIIKDKGEYVAGIERFTIVNYNEMFDVVMSKDANIQLATIETVRKKRGTGVFGSTAKQKKYNDNANDVEIPKMELNDKHFKKFDVPFTTELFETCNNTTQFKEKKVSFFK